MSKRISAHFYTKGKFGRGIRETVDTNNPCLYAYGRYKTKIREEELPDDYIPIHSRSIWYMQGFLKTTGIVDMDYTYCKENHLFKDDYIYISYTEKLQTKISQWGYPDIINYDVCISGNDIVDIVLAAEKYSGFDTRQIRKKIEEKRVWLRDNEPDYYAMAVKEDRDIFELWISKGHVDHRLISGDRENE